MNCRGGGQVIESNDGVMLSVQFLYRLRKQLRMVPFQVIHGGSAKFVDKLDQFLDVRFVDLADVLIFEGVAGRTA